MLLTLLSPQGSGLQYYDQADVLDAHRNRYEEQIAAQLLKARQAKKRQYDVVKKAIDWKTLFVEKINVVETLDQLDKVTIPTLKTEYKDLTSAIINELIQKKEQKRIELELAKQEAELQAFELEKQTASKLAEQRQAIQAAKQLQIEVLERYKIAVDAAVELERRAFEEAKIAEQKALEFTKKREQRIKRLKALMWLAGLDI